MIVLVWFMAWIANRVQLSMWEDIIFTWNFQLPLVWQVIGFARCYCPVDCHDCVEAGQLLHGHGGIEGQRPVNSSSTGAAAGGSKKRRFKCSKCQVKFKKREDCLRHIHAQHSSASASSRRKLQFTSPKHSSAKAVRNNRVRSHYVKRLMEILRVPTSRGTPSSVSNHIMQAFLIKSQQEMEAADADNDCFVPSMVYLPVARKINQPMTVAFNLTPAWIKWPQKKN